MQINNDTRGTTICDRAKHARSFVSRGVGLLGKRGLESGEGLLIDPCSSIHMFFMRFPVDVVYIDRQGNVVKTVHRLKPWRISAARHARTTLELPVGAIDASGTQVGDTLSFEN